MLRSYDPALVVASLVVATLAAYAALDLTGQVARSRGRARLAWLAGGAVALGAGIWGMHFVGMLAFHLRDPAGGPVPIAYDVPRVLLSGLVAVAASALALAAAARAELGRGSLATAGLTMGVAIAGMHYLGVNAMRLPGAAPGSPAGVTYRPALVAAAYAIAVGASLAALAIARRVHGLGTVAPVRAGASVVAPPPAREVGLWALVPAALLMGGAIAGMHYVGMASAHFHPAAGGGHAVLVAGADARVLATPALGAGVTVAVFLVLALTLLGSTARRWARTDGDPPAVGERAPSARAGDPSLRAKLAAAVGAAGLVLVVGALGYLGLWQYREAARLVQHTGDVRAALARVAAAMSEAESGARGFMLTEQAAFAAEFGRAAARARGALDEARRLTADNAAQQQRLAALAPVLERRLGVLDMHMAERRARGVAAAAAGMATSRGPALADSVRRTVAAADAEEARLLTGRDRVLARRGRLLDLVLLGGSLAAFTLIALVTQAIRQDVLRREAAERRVRAQADELRAQADELRAQADHLEQQQVELETQLEEQQALTEELAHTNAELQAAEAASAVALAEARREEARYRALVEAGSQVVWTTPPSGELLGEQPGWAEFTGQTPEEYRGWGWLDAVHPDDREPTAARWEMALAAVAAGGPGDRASRYDVEHRVRRRDGVYRVMQARGVPVVDEAGGVREWVGVETDVTAERSARTQREALIAALARSNRDLDQFAYVASHDLKAPLRGISNLSSWIEEDLAAVMTPDVREQLTLLRGRVHRMEALIDGILAYSRAGRVRGEPERVDTGALAREVVELLAPPAGARVEVADGMPTVLAERVPLQQVFLNLVGNALKYAGRADAVVRVGWNADAPGWYRFSVADNGPGIAPQYHERVFGIFQTLQSRDRVEGTGIGLSVVKKIVEAQGARVWVESAEGAGATFHFTWPEAPPAA